MPVGQYRKKPVVIEAVQWTGLPDSAEEIALWMGCTDDHPLIHTPSADAEWQGTLTIPTLEGDMLASVGDFIIRGVNGEFYPCKPDIFEKTYDPADDLVSFDFGETFHDLRDPEVQRGFLQALKEQGIPITDG